MYQKQHQVLTLWAAACAEKVLPQFEQDEPEDDRPRKAIEAARAWVRGDIKLTEARTFAFGAHAAAREAVRPEARAAARSASHAAATAHVPKHARYAASYALRATDNPTKEREWQRQKLPGTLHSLAYL